MTAEEEDLRMVQLMVETRRAERELEKVRREAALAAEEHMSISGALRKNIDLDPTQADFTQDGEHASRLTPTQITYEGGARAAGLIAKMRKARQDLYNLYERKKKLPAL